MTNKCYFFTLALLLCTTIARAQYNQVNDIPYRDAAQGYAQERCKLDVYYPTNSTATATSSLPSPHWPRTAPTKSAAKSVTSYS